MPKDQYGVEIKEMLFVDSDNEERVVGVIDYLDFVLEDCAGESGMMEGIENKCDEAISVVGRLLEVMAGMGLTASDIYYIANGTRKDVEFVDAR